MVEAESEAEVESGDEEVSGQEGRRVGPSACRAHGIRKHATVLNSGT
jgi:hypothetical protein